MAAVAAEADGAQLWGQVVGQPEPGPLMDERVLRRLCGMLDVPAAGSLTDQATACRAALLSGTGESEEETPVTVQPGAFGGARGSIESLGRWNEKRDDRAMPLKFEAVDDRDGTGVRVGFGKFVDQLMQTKGASSGILAISNWKEMRGPHEVTLSEMSWSEVSWSEVPWSASGTSYQRHGAPDEAARLRAEAKKKGKEPLKIRFAASRAPSKIWETTTKWRSTASRCRAEASTRTSGPVARRRPRRRTSTPARGATGC